MPMNRILLVDDDDDFRRMIQLTLQKFGYEVIEARNGKEALRLQRESGADVMLTDLIMPEQEGLETIQAFRRQFPHVNIIAMSGGGRYNLTDFLATARLFGAKRTLVKPFAKEALLAAVQAVLPSPAASGSAAPRSGAA